MQKKILSSVFVIVLLASCGPIGMAQPQPTNAPATLPPTWTPTPGPTAIPTFTEIPTFTVVPAFTPLAPPTPDSVDALHDRFQDSLFSPNGNWVAYRDPEKLRVVNTEDRNRVWTLPCEMFEECSTVYPVVWLSSRILYFAPAPKTGGAPEGISLVTALARIDVRTGKWEMVLPDSDHHYDFAFSPDEDYLAYTQSSGSEAEEPSVTMGVLSIINKQKPHHFFKLDGASYAGDIIWSPFKPRIVFVVQDAEKGSGVAYYDMEITFFKLALDIAPRDIVLSAWNRNNLVSLEEMDWETHLREYRVLNPFTGELEGERITATPSE